MRTNAGFTLTEMLIALLITVMVTAIVAAGIPVAVNSYTRIVTSANAQILLSTTMTCLRDELGTASHIKIEDGVISYTNSHGAKSAIYIGEDNDPRIYVHVNTDNTQTGGYKYPLVSREASDNKLHVTYVINGYSGGVLTFTDITVKNGDETLVSFPVFKIRVLADIS